MKVLKKSSEFGLQTILENNDKYVVFKMGGNGDLYWTFYSKNNDDNHRFIITKENYGIYELFIKLFNDIDGINIFDDDFNINMDKEQFKIRNYSNYNELYDKNNNTIIWYSDETSYKVSNILKIIKEKDTFILEFNNQESIKGYDEDVHSSLFIPIRFRNRGSRYDPFNIVFMKLYYKLLSIDDVKDYGHQIHIEEYLYNKKVLINGGKNYD